MKPKGLGRGLDALLDSGETVSAPAVPNQLKVDQLQKGKYQPRTNINEASLQELADSIRKQGLVQPIIVRPLAEGSGERYEIIAGERRWRAARLAGLHEVPVVVREVSDETALAIALIENIQREDLNAVEQARGLQRLSAEFGFTHQEIAEAVGRSRSAITNLLRLLNLSQPVLELVQEGRLDMGHARALLSLEGSLQQDVARKIARKGLSVREAESWVQQLLNPLARISAKRARAQDRDVQRLAEELSERFGTTVEIKAGRKGSGKLVISYSDSRHLESLLSKFN
ncbi:MAG: chromosome partitioning protein ParB [Betaproteobacteria bacterium RIFCSPLOWO2_02_FULL_65_24]|nr:MAG: chromosome partitioning protein ParB [Betaproteobacteria bacterium RIFCSPLOWO2_02_FULL_65_24]OGA83626.1 MAG: chromosome partitioning protein ParB [Betaproteobacteria bacterium RIFCSPLOWO2_12_FULL_66_14]